VAPWLLVWLIVGIVAATALVACLIGLVRHVLVLGRSARELQQAISPITEELSREGARAGDRAGSLSGPGGGRWVHR
jgi:hypothetical protein